MKTRKPFLLRIDPVLFQELEAWAQQELRSVNGQIEYVLKQAVAHRKGKPDAAERAPSDGAREATVEDHNERGTTL
jgi:hypothetical protein